jgi:hypothetical protein
VGHEYPPRSDEHLRVARLGVAPTPQAFTGQFRQPGQEVFAVPEVVPIPGDHRGAVAIGSDVIRIAPAGGATDIHVIGSRSALAVAMNDHGRDQSSHLDLLGTQRA